MLKISIVTVTYNSEKFIEETIKSVLSQTYQNIEHIIIDGGSTDKTIEIVKRYQDEIAYFKSEPDKNMYDAINKGCEVATGDYVAILNSDDYYCNTEVVERVVKSLNLNPSDGIYGNRLEVNEFREFVKRKKTFKVGFKTLLLSRNLTFISHPCLFVAKDVFKKVGYYDIRFSYASDLDFVLRCLKIIDFYYLDIDVACFRLHGGSITASGKINFEREDVLLKHGIDNYSILQQKIGYLYVWGKYFIRNPKNFIRKYLY